MKESTLFFSKFLRGKRKVGSVLPSSRFLTRAMMKLLPFENTRFLLELGGGTGPLTQELIRRKLESTQLLVFEPDEEFAEILETKFGPEKNVTILRKKADDLQGALRALNLPPPDCIVSSLPFALLGEETSKKIFTEIQAALHPKGLLLLYQYTGLMLPLLLKHFEIKRFSFVLLNVPPALVFLCAPRRAR